MHNYFFDILKIPQEQHICLHAADNNVAALQRDVQERCRTDIKRKTSNVEDCCIPVGFEASLKEARSLRAAFDRSITNVILE